MAFPPIDTSAHLQEVYLLCLFADDLALHAYNEQFPTLHFKRWHPLIVNVLEEEVSKSRAIQKVLDYFGYSTAEAMAFGDGENDFDMLALVDFGVAMGNASERLKSIAHFVTKDSHHDGVTWALKKLHYI